jgi:hypothetical protein
MGLPVFAKNDAETSQGIAFGATDKRSCSEQTAGFPAFYPKVLFERRGTLANAAHWFIIVAWSA